MRPLQPASLHRRAIYSAFTDLTDYLWGAANPSRRMLRNLEGFASTPEGCDVMRPRMARKPDGGAPNRCGNLHSEAARRRDANFHCAVNIAVIPNDKWLRSIRDQRRSPSDPSAPHRNPAARRELTHGSACSDSAEPAQVRRLKQMPQPGSSYQAPGVVARGCKSESNRRSRGWRVG